MGFFFFFHCFSWHNPLPRKEQSRVYRCFLTGAAQLQSEGLVTLCNKTLNSMWPETFSFFPANKPPLLIRCVFRMLADKMSCILTAHPPTPHTQSQQHVTQKAFSCVTNMSSYHRCCCMKLFLTRDMCLVWKCILFFFFYV